jgi:hypothetical protein
VRTLDQARLDAMPADAWSHADGYRLMRWTGSPTNEHMLRINRAMGFREVESVIEWQLTV